MAICHPKVEGYLQYNLVYLKYLQFLSDPIVKLVILGNIWQENQITLEQGFNLLIKPPGLTSPTKIRMEKMSP